YGFSPPDSGDIRANGNLAVAAAADGAIADGARQADQHFMLVHDFTVLEYTTLGDECEGLLNTSTATARSSLVRRELEYGRAVHPSAIIDELPVGLQQRVEILKALYRGAEILILDEPTGVLTPAEADHLFRILAQLKEEGKTVVLITHKLRE